MNDHGRDIPTIGRQGDAPPPEREYDNTPAWGQVTDVAWDLDEAIGDREVILECTERIKEIERRLRGSYYSAAVPFLKRLRTAWSDLDAVISYNPAGTEWSVDTREVLRVVACLDEIAGELHEELFVKRGIVL